MKIPIFQITVNDGRRTADRESVQKLADSISKVGLLNPITVDQEYTLIAGLHRLEAAKLLGWTEIECTVSSLEGLQAKLAEIDENFVRKGLSKIEYGELLLRRKEIYEALHPETRRGMRNGQTSKSEKFSLLEAKSFIQDTAEKQGVTPRTIAAQIQTAKNLTPEAKEIIRNADEKVTKQSALKISRLAPEQQREAASQLASGVIHSVDEYRPAPLEPKENTTDSAEPPPTDPVPAPPASERYYATIRDSVADLKNPDKDRSRTPEMFLASFTFFLQRFCLGIQDYTSDENAAVYPALTPEQLEQIRDKVNSTCTALSGLFHKMERMAQK